MVRKLFYLVCIGLLINSCEAQKDLDVGVKAPKISISNWLEKEPELENRAIVIDFWFTNCAPCIASIPHLNELVNAYENEPIVFIAATDDSRKKVEVFKKKRNLNILSHVGIYKGNSLERRFGVSAFPQSYLIDNEGILRWSGSPLLLTTSLIDEILGTRKDKAQNQIAEFVGDNERLLIRKSSAPNPGNKLDQPSPSLRRSVFMGNSLSQFVATMNEVSISRIQIDTSIMNRKYDITYEDLAYNGNLIDHNKHLLNLVLSTLDVSIDKRPIKAHGLLLKVRDASRLGSHKTTSQKLSVNNNIIDGSISLNHLSSLIEEQYGLYVKSGQQDETLYKMKLELSGIEELSKVLSDDYGLELIEDKIEIIKTILTQK